MDCDAEPDGEVEDNTLLDSMIYSQMKLQASVLEAFGAEAESKNR